MSFILDLVGFHQLKNFDYILPVDLSLVESQVNHPLILWGCGVSHVQGCHQVSYYMYYPMDSYGNPGQGERGGEGRRGGEEEAEGPGYCCCLLPYMFMV